MLKHTIIGSLLLFSVFGFAQTPQNSGIGTANPQSKLEIKSTTNDNTKSALNVTDSDSKSLLFVRNDGNVGVGVTTPTAYIDISSSTLYKASLRLRSGLAPTTPNDGDIWYDGTNLKFRKGTTTVDLTGASGVGSLTGTANQILYFDANGNAAGNDKVIYNNGFQVKGIGSSSNTYQFISKTSNNEEVFTIRDDKKIFAKGTLVIAAPNSLGLGETFYNQGSFYTDGEFMVRTSSGEGKIHMHPSGEVIIGYQGAFGESNAFAVSGMSFFQSATNTSSSYAIRAFNTDHNAFGYNGELFSVRGDGRIGIRNATPTAILDIVGSTVNEASLRLRSGVAPISPNDGDIWYDGTNLKFRKGTSTVDLTGVSGGGSGQWTEDGSNIYRVSGACLIGTSTWDTYHKLQVEGKIKSSIGYTWADQQYGDWQFYSPADATNFPNGQLKLVHGGVGDMLVISGYGNIGAGLAVPTARLHLKGPNNYSSEYSLKIDNSANNNLLSVRNDGMVTIGNGTGVHPLMVNVGSATSYTGEKYSFEVGGGAWNMGYNATQNAMTFLTTGSSSGNWIFGNGTSANPNIKMMYNTGYGGFGVIVGSNVNAVAHFKMASAGNANDNIIIAENSSGATRFAVQNDGKTSINGTANVINAGAGAALNLQSELTSSAPILNLFNSDASLTANQETQIEFKQGNTGSASSIGRFSNVFFGGQVTGFKFYGLNASGFMSPSLLTLKGDGLVGVSTDAPKSTLDINGSLSYKVVNINSNYTASHESILIADASSGNITITLPAASSVDGRTYTIKKSTAANQVIVDGNGAETIDGAATKTLSAQYAKLTLVSNSGNWFVIED